MRFALFLLAALSPAQSLPSSPAESLAGRKLAVPAAFAGQPAVVVWSFSRDAGERVKDWLVPLYKEGLPAWSAAMLEAAPRFIRPLIRGGMKKDTPAQFLDRTLCLYKDEKQWRAALGVVNGKLPLVVIFDARSRLVWKHAGHFDPAVLAALRLQLNALQSPAAPPPRPAPPSGPSSSR